MYQDICQDETIGAQKIASQKPNIYKHIYNKNITNIKKNGWKLNFGGQYTMIINPR